MKPNGADLWTWLREMDLQDWNHEFSACPSEVADLVIAARLSDAALTSKVLAGEEVTITFRTVDEREATGGGATLRECDDEMPARMGIWQDDQLVGHVESGHHDDVRRLLRVGVPLTVRVNMPEWPWDAPSLSIRTDVIEVAQ